MKWKQKKRRWLVRNCRKLAKRKRRSEHSKGSSSLQNIDGGRKKVGRYYQLVAPQNFSVCDNHEETAKYLTTIYNAVIKGLYDKKIYLDFSSITDVSIESIVYIIAILRNVRLSPRCTYEFNGNFPKDEKARKIFEESGFLNYVKSKSNRLPIPKCGDRIQIVSGDNCDTKIAKDVYDFAMGSELVSEEECRQLYKIMIELMSNTIQHAYKNESDNMLLPAWYLYCQNTGQKLVFNFVDIGDGIPNTINKKTFREAFLSDSDAIASAMRGEFRSETKKPNRGKGLPFIREKIEEGMIKKFKVVSGKGSFYYDFSSDDFQTSQYSNAIFGTIFYWEMGGE